MLYGIIYLVVGGLISTICTCTTTPTMSDVYGSILGGLIIGIGLAVISLTYQDKLEKAKENESNESRRKE